MGEETRRVLLEIAKELEERRKSYRGLAKRWLQDSRGVDYEAAAMARARASELESVTWMLRRHAGEPEANQGAHGPPASEPPAPNLTSKERQRREQLIYLKHRGGGLDEAEALELAELQEKLMNHTNSNYPLPKPPAPTCPECKDELDNLRTGEIPVDIWFCHNCNKEWGYKDLWHDREES